MLILFTFVLLLVSIILVDYIIRETKARLQEFRQTRRILGEHPEMKGVDPEEEGLDRKSTRLNSSHSQQSRMPSSA